MDVLEYPEQVISNEALKLKQHILRYNVLVS